jgi:hypothetical protein
MPLSLLKQVKALSCQEYLILQLTLQLSDYCGVYRVIFLVFQNTTAMIESVNRTEMVHWFFISLRDFD